MDSEKINFATILSNQFTYIIGARRYPRVTSSSWFPCNKSSSSPASENKTKLMMFRPAATLKDGKSNNDQLKIPNMNIVQLYVLYAREKYTQYWLTP